MASRVWVKICGVTRAEDAEVALAAGADAIGINFWPGSKRHCSIERAREIASVVESRALVFGVFVGEKRARIREVVAEVGLGGVQFHGGEPAEEAAGWELPVIRAVAAASREAVESALLDRRADPRTRTGGFGLRLLVDHASGGGSGQTVGDTLLEGLDLGEAILAGGLTAENVSAMVARHRPFGVDVAGGVERAPGIKDEARIRAFVAAAREARRE